MMAGQERRQAVVIFDTTICRLPWRVRANVTFARGGSPAAVKIDWLRPAGDDSEELTERQAVDRFGAEVVNGILILAARAAGGGRRD